MNVVKKVLDQGIKITIQPTDQQDIKKSLTGGWILKCQCSDEINIDKSDLKSEAGYKEVKKYVEFYRCFQKDIDEGTTSLGPSLGYFYAERIRQWRASSWEFSNRYPEYSGTIKKSCPTCGREHQIRFIIESKIKPIPTMKYVDAYRKWGFDLNHPKTFKVLSTLATRNRFESAEAYAEYIKGLVNDLDQLSTLTTHLKEECSKVANKFTGELGKNAVEDIVIMLTRHEKKRREEIVSYLELIFERIADEVKTSVRSRPIIR